jgi:hypothetical protein
MEPLLKNVFEEFHCRKFYDHCDIQRDFELAKSIKNDGKKKRYFFRPDGRLNTIDKETYLENYGNKLWNIHHNRVTLVLEDNEDKVSIKAYFYVKYRTEGKHYFVTNKRVEFLTFNKKSKIVYVGIKYNKGKSFWLIKHSSIKVFVIFNNRFFVLKEIFKNIRLLFIFFHLHIFFEDLKVTIY